MIHPYLKNDILNSSELNNGENAFRAAYLRLSTEGTNKQSAGDQKELNEINEKQNAVAAFWEDRNLPQLGKTFATDEYVSAELILAHLAFDCTDF